MNITSNVDCHNLLTTEHVLFIVSDVHYISTILFYTAEYLEKFA